MSDAGSTRGGVVPHTGPMTSYRILGINDEQTVCDACGRVELRRTVILADEDGTEAGRYGTTCAAKILGRTGRGQGVKVWDEAVAAHRATVRDAQEAVKVIAYYEDAEDDADALVARFRAAHRHAIWEHRTTDAEILVMARDMFTRRRAQVAAAAVLVG